jgi:hypothetical protein
MAVRAVLLSKSLHAEPGAEALATMTIRNTGMVVDHLHIEVVGDVAPWATVTPAMLPLFPDAEGSVTVSFRPPRSSTARAGTMSFGVRVTSEVDPQFATVEEGTLEIGAFTQLSAELSPEISHGRRVGRHDLACDNYGNTPIVLAFGGVDPENALRFNFRPASVVGEPGTATVVGLRVRPRRRFLTGKAKTHSFRLVVQPKAGAPVSVNGSMVQMALLPTWLPVALGGLLALLAVAVVVLVLPGPKLGSSSAPTPTPSLSTPTSTATPTSTPTASLAATTAQLTAVGAAVYPRCGAGQCPGPGWYTTCTEGQSGSSLYSACPLTTRLIIQLTADSSGVASAPDMLGGGQDPFWQTESFTAAPSTTGGIVHTVLSVQGQTFKFDFTVVLQSGTLAVDDIYCSGTDPASSDAYASGWAGRSACVS